MGIFSRFRDVFGFKRYTLHESSLSRIYQHSQERTIGMMTAFRGDLPLKDNIARNKSLENAIRNSGFGFVRVQGHYVENPNTPEERKVVENSYLIISSEDDNGKLKGFLKRQGRTFNQDSVLYKEFGQKAILIGTSMGGSWPGLDKEVVVGDFHANKIGQFYTKMRGLRSFTFESVESPEGVLTLAYKK